MRILLVVYDNGSFINGFPIGVAYIAAILLKKGYAVEIYNQDENHYPEGHLTDYLNKNKFDVIGLGVIAGYYQYRKMLRISEAINASKNRPFYVIGGHGPSPEPEFFLKKTLADVAVMGEGEETIIELMEAIQNKRPLINIKGLAFRNGEKVVVNQRRQLIKDIDALPFPAYDLFPIEYYRLRLSPYVSSADFSMPIISGRGCTFECNFCYRLDTGFRPRSNESIIEEIKLLKQKYRITDITFSCELFMSSIERTISICEAFIKSKLGVTWNCNGRLNYAKPDVLKLMKQAGCKMINYGIEAMDDHVLKNMKKGLTVKMIQAGIDATVNAGISPGLNILFGNIGDNRDTLDKGVAFLLKYEDGVQFRTIRPVTPYPGSPLYYYAIEKGLLKDCDDFYENKHLNSDLVAVNFTELTDEEFHLCLFEANTRLIKNYYQKKLQAVLENTKKLYLEKNVNFRGFRHN